MWWTWVYTKWSEIARWCKWRDVTIKKENDVNVKRLLREVETNKNARYKGERERLENKCFIWWARGDKQGKDKDQRITTKDWYIVFIKLKTTFQFTLESGRDLRFTKEKQFCIKQECYIN